MNSTTDTLHQMLHKIGASQIASPLLSFGMNDSANQTRQILEKNDFDIAGVRSEGRVTGVIIRENITGGLVKDNLTQIPDRHLIEDFLPMLEALEELAEQEWLIVRYSGLPSGIITPSDLQKIPCRLWMFGIISLFETNMTNMVITNHPDDGWRNLIYPERLQKALGYYEQLRHQNRQIGLVDCLQFMDKATILKNNALLLQGVGYYSQESWDNFTRSANQLRDKLAHSAPLNLANWKEIIATVNKVDGALVHLERLLQTNQ